MTVRPFAEADRDAAEAVLAACFDYPTAYNAPAASIRRKAAAADGLFWVAEDGGAVVGTVMAGWDGHRGWIYSLGVLPGHRGSGIGTALMRRALDELAARDCPKVNLQVVEGNRGVVDFYARLGFKVEERISMGRVTP